MSSDWAQLWVLKHEGKAQLYRARHLTELAAEQPELAATSGGRDDLVRAPGTWGGRGGEAAPLVLVGCVSVEIRVDLTAMSIVSCVANPTRRCRQAHTVEPS